MCGIQAARDLPIASGWPWRDVAIPIMGLSQAQGFRCVVVG
jgi:hypothetical protein